MNKSINARIFILATVLLAFLFVFNSYNAFAEEDIIVTDDVLEVSEEAATDIENNGDEFATKRLMLTYSGTDVESFGAVKTIQFNDLYIFVYDSPEDTERAFKALKNRYGIDNIAIDYPVKAEASGWGAAYMGFENINPTVLSSGANVKVAVIDTGINRSHVIFNGTDVLTGVNLIDDSYDVTDDNGHGTATAGIIAESTASNVSIMPIKVLDDEGKGSLLHAILGVIYADDLGCDVINLSLGSTQDAEVTAAMDSHLKDINALIVCASGNESKDIDAINCYPAVSPYTVSVSAIGSNSKIASYSNYGKSIDFTAPGSGVKLAYIGSASTYATLSGTSFSSPYIAAAAASVKSVYTHMSNDDIYDYLKSISKDLGTKGKDKYYGNGVPIFPSKSSAFKVSPTVKMKTRLVYNGKVRKPSITVKINGDKLKSSEYTVKWPDGRKKVGSYKVKISLVGNYKGTVTKTFKIVPQKTSISKLTKHSKALTVKWKKIKNQASGYQIQAATNKKFTKNKKTVTVKGKSKNSKKITKLKGSRKYYVRVRTYKIRDGKKYYSSWSKTKSMSTKK